MDDQEAVKTAAEQWLTWDPNPATRGAVGQALQSAIRGTGTWETVKVSVVPLVIPGS